MDWYSLFLTLHIASFIWNIFWVVVSDAVGLLWITGKKALAPGHFLRLTHRFIFWGLGVSIVTGVYLFSTVADYLLTVPAFYTKLLLVAALIVNGFVIGRHISVAETTPYKAVTSEEKRKLFISGAVSTVGWVGVFISAQLLGL